MSFDKGWFDFPHSVKWGMLFCLLYASGVVYYAGHHSWFLGQDFDHLVLLQNLSYLDYLVTPIDIHNPLPLHRFFCWLFYKPMGMNFPVALLMLGVFHLAGVYYFFRVLQHIRPGFSSIFLAGVFCINFYVLDLFFWWSAGLHRFPYLALIFAACYMALDRSWLAKPVHVIVFVALAQLVGLGFFEKAVFLPLYLAACFSAVYCIQGRRPSRLQIGIAAVSLAISLVYLMISPHGLQEYPSFQQAFSAGIRYFHYYLISILPWRPSVPPSFPVVLLVYGVVSLVCVALNRGIIVAIIFLALALGVSIAPLVHSSRILLFGQDVVLGARYFHDNLFLLLIFFHLVVGVCVRRFQEGELPPVSAKWGGGLILVLCAYGLVAFESSRQEVTDLYSKDGHSGGERAARFMANLASSIQKESAQESPLRLQDRIAPQSLYVAVFGSPELPLSTILMWYDKKIIFVGTNAGYAVNDDGTLKKLND